MWSSHIKSSLTSSQPYLLPNLAPTNILDIMKGLRSWSWGSFLRYPDKEDRKRIEKKEILPRKELNYQTEANTPHEINDLLNDINKLRYAQNQSLPDIRTSYPGTPWYEEILLPMDFGRLPLQSYCDDPYSPIPMIYGAYERKGIKLCSVGRNFA